MLGLPLMNSIPCFIPKRIQTFGRVGAVVVATALGITGCGTDEKSASKSADTGTARTDVECASPGISTATIASQDVAQSVEPEPFVAPAALRGERITVYSGRDEELIQPLVDTFTERTGVTVEVRYGDSAEVGAQLLEEGDATSADVFYSQEVGAVGVLAKAGLLGTLPESITTSVEERFQPGSDRAWVGVTGRSRVMVYNPTILESPPQCVAALVNDEYRGKVAMVPSNAGFQAFVTGFRVSKGEDAARTWLEQMMDNDVVTDIASNSDVLDAVSAGTVPIGLINHYYWARHEDRDNLNAELMFPTGDDPGALVNATAVGATTNGAKRPAALAFIEFLLSPEGQTYFVNETWEYPVVDGIADPAGVPAMADLEGPALDLTDLDSLEQTQQLLADLGLDLS